MHLASAGLSQRHTAQSMSFDLFMTLHILQIHSLLHAEKVNLFLDPREAAKRRIVCYSYTELFQIFLFSGETIFSSFNKY